MTAPRYRCKACGNLTRFDVTATRTTRSFHHYSVGGELKVEEEVVLSETVDDVSCRWCGNGRAVEEIATEPAGDRPAGDRPAGERPAGDRPAGERTDTATHAPGR